MAFVKNTCCAVALGLTSACGGGAVSDVVVPLTIPLLNAPAGGPATTVDVLSLDTSTSALSTETGSLVENVLTGSIVAGTMDAATGNIVLSGGGSGRVLGGKSGSTEHFLFSTGTSIGVVGVPATGLGTTTASYSTDVLVIVNDGADRGALSLTGSGTMAVDFGAGSATLTSTLDDAGGPASLSITGAKITGNGISEGTLGLTGPFAATPLGTGTLANHGGFFGDGGTELGGVFHQDETALGNELTVTGSYSGTLD